MGCDRVDDPADRVGAIEERRRTAHDLDAFEPVRVDRHPVVAGLAREVARPDPVLHHQHSVAIESTDNRSARPRSETSFRHTRLVLEGVTQGACHVRRQFKGVERRDCVERLEGRRSATRRGGDRHLFVHRGQLQGEVDRRRLLGVDRDGLASSGEMLALRQDLVGASWHVLDLEFTVLCAQRDQARPDHEHHGTVHGDTAFGKRDGALHGARTLTVDRYTCQRDDNRRRDDKTSESLMKPHGSGSIPGHPRWSDFRRTLHTYTVGPIG